jgi:uncharacterized alpha-E superfamily protein
MSSSVVTQAKFPLTRPPRPMLSRDADSIYWMSRYVERAEHVARVLWVNSHLLIDVGELAPDLQQRQWQSVLTIMRAGELPAVVGGEGVGTEAAVAQKIAQHMTFNAENPNSLFSCISKARENARSVRETISAEMWENLNTLYWTLNDAPARFDEAPDDFYRQVIYGSMLFQGLTDQTLPHDQRWHFAQLGKYLERIEVTSRIIEVKFTILRAAEPKLETPIRNIHWMSMLRSCCSIEAYRRNNIGDMDPLRVATFLILEPDFPRSIHFAVTQAYQAISAVRSEIDPRSIDPAEKTLGRLKAQLDYAERGEITRQGVPQYLQKIQMDVVEAAMGIQKTYFLH